MKFNACLLALVLGVFTFSSGSVALVYAQEKKPAEPIATSNTKPNRLDNGIYLVLRKSVDRADILPVTNNEKLAITNQSFLALEERTPRTFMVLQEQPFIKLKLGKKPLAQKDERAHTKLLLQLSKEQVEPLRKFTEKNLKRELAIVIGGKVVTSHQIKEEIKDGRFQITRCTDDGCAVIYSMLIDEAN